MGYNSNMRVHWKFLFVRGGVTCLLALFFIVPAVARAGILGMVSDLISDSQPSATTTLHTITFIPPNAIPASGRIILRPEAVGGSAFTIPVGFDHTDTTVSVSTGGGPFIPRSLAATQSALNDGVSVVSGTNGTITFVLAAGFNIPAGSTVRITLGNTRFITSPPAPNSYRIRIETRSAINAVIDRGSAMIAIVTPVTILTGAGDVTPPLRSNGLPSGLLPGSTLSVMLSLNTDRPATCKYATTSGIGFFTMSSSTIFSKANLETLHYVNIPTAEDNLYRFYVRCMNESSIVNPDDYPIQFEVGVIPNASTTPAPPPPPPGPSGPSGGGGGGGLFLQQGIVTMEGRAIPMGTLVFLKDGVVVKEVASTVLGTFTEQFAGLDRGTYTWGVYVRDPNGKQSATYNSTIYLIGGSNNLIAPVYLSPTVSVKETTIPIGETVRVSGYGIPITPVEVFMTKHGDALSDIVTASTTANGDGSWSVELPTDRVSKGTYEVKAHSVVTSRDRSNFSPIVYVGLGEDPDPDFGNRSDLNKDGKVNLVDFSILLFNWKTSDAVADINQDGTVNLTDFSIMLSNWTG